MNFDALGLSPDLCRAAATAGYERPTPIQAQAVPAVLRGVDVLALAATGSGKTAAYALPLLQDWLASAPATPRKVHALVLVPTRELAAQVGEVLRRLGDALPRRPKVAVVAGGVSINPQMMFLRGGADLVVATPGRLLDLLARNAVKLAAVRALVLDEADRLLDLGFADELAKVLEALPARRQNLFFSATFAPGVQGLAATLLREPERIEVDANDVADPAAEPLLAQRVIRVDPERRTALLKHLAKEGGWSRALVFVATRQDCEHVAWKLYKAGLHAVPFHGEMSQGQRSEVLQQFKDGDWDMLVTTDLAGRGIDIPGLPVVVNYDLPRSADQYVHRVGRTARAGAQGLAVSFVSAATEAHFRLIEKRQGLSLPREQVEGFEPTEPDPVPGAPGTGGIKGKRPSKKDKLRAAAAAKGTAD